ncbi:MAG TPA: hypothetical protein VEL28_05595 [Candidatus Binatia bacterium]|nr:hypothetical protein [Candidatus Binatia bacterium]
MLRTLTVPFLVVALLCSAVHAADVPVVPTKLIVITSSGESKVVLLVKDPAVAKGPGTTADISAEVHIGYGGTTGVFSMPQGERWRNQDDKASYRNTDAPAGGSVKKHAIKVGKSLKLTAMSLGDTPLDISAASHLPVTVAEVVENGGVTTRLCGQFSSCTHKTTGAGSKLVCKGTGTTDPTCSALPGPSSTSTSTSTLAPPTSTTLPVPTTTMATTSSTEAPTTTTVPAPTTTELPTTTTEAPTTTLPPTCTPGATRPCSTGLEGVCADGTEVCDGTDYGACNQHISASPETCGDNRDNDCDGTADDGCVCFPNSTEACVTGSSGVCAAGSRTCDAIGSGYGACTALSAPSAEQCGNGEDEDCDGNLDNGCFVGTSTTVGTCQPLSCQNGGTWDPDLCACSCYPKISGSTCQTYDCFAGHVDPSFCVAVTQADCAVPDNRGACPQRCLCQ